MTRVLVLGAAGGIGSIAARTVAVADEFAEIVLADVRPEALSQVVADVRRLAGPVAVATRHVDVDDGGSLRELLGQVDLVVNCIGPFYRFGPPLLQAAIEAGTDYVDVCDDLDPTRTMLAMDGAARDRDVCALVGMGNSPGLANVLVRYCADLLLDTVETVDIMHIHGGEPAEGPAVLKHRIHAMVSDVPVWENGAMRTVRMLAPSGQAYVKDVDFRDVGRYPVYPYPHPETITLPEHLSGVQRVTNRGVVFPLTYFDLTKQMVLADMCTTEPLVVDGQPVIPIDVAVARLIDRRPALLTEAGVTGPAGCLRIDVSGNKDGEQHAYVFSLSSSSAGAGEGTGIPAGLGAVLLSRGDLRRPGVHAPEGLVDPMAMLALAASVLGALDVAGSGGSALPIHIAHHQPDGNVAEVDLAL